MSGLIVNCDWGTTQFRLRAVRLDDFSVVGEVRSLDGVATLTGPADPKVRAGLYANVLSDGMQRLAAQEGAALRGAPILISGMASSSIGWQELPYDRLPLPLDGSRLACRELTQVPGEFGPHRVVLITGVRGDSDVMRGEETELVGLFTLPDYGRFAQRAMVILPGTHSKHLRVEKRRLVSFQTFITGELFDLLSEHSLLRHSLVVPHPGDTSARFALDELRRGVEHARTVPLPAALFRVRTRHVLDGISGPANAAFLGGVLAGSELAYLAEGAEGDVPLVLCATEPLSAHYCAAFEALGLADRLTVVDPAEVELLSARGQAVIWRNLSVL